METININGVEYVKASEVPQGYQQSDHVCVICTNGWIFEGHQDPDDGTKLISAHVVRSWSNGLGIGGLADPDHKDDYTLDYIGDIQLHDRAIVATIQLGW